YARFVKELETRQQKLSEFVVLKHRALVGSSKQRVAEYLLAAQKAQAQPTTEEFMLLADGNDLNPTMVIRWQAYLERMRKNHDPVFSLWHALANLPEKSFAQDAIRLIGKHVAAVESGDDSFGVVNPVILREVCARPPGSLAELAQAYGRLLNGVEGLWQE